MHSNNLTITLKLNVKSAKKEEEIKIKEINSSANPMKGKIPALILTVLILIIGTFFYFTAISNPAGMSIKSSKLMDANSQEQISSNDNSILKTDFKYQIYGVQNNNVYMKTDSKGIQKLFYYHNVNDPLNIQLSEGNIDDYQIHTIGGQNYYPLILGFDEAKIMREEGLFSNIGDPIKNFFGKNVVIVGVMKKTGGALDFAYLIPLNSRELN